MDKIKGLWPINCNNCNVGGVRVVYNKNDKVVFGITCCYYASLIWSIIG